MEAANRGSLTRYRAGHESRVDESLFGSSEKSKTQSHTRTTIIPPNSVIISKSDLERIKLQATVKSERELEEERSRALAIVEERERKAKERKARMIELEMQAKKHMKKSDVELAALAKEDAIRKWAAEKVNDNTDLNKTLSTLAARAAAFTIRDKQLQDKSQREAEEDEYERRMDMVMELDRLKDLQRRSDEENMKRQKRVDDRKVIVEQMESRQRMKLLAAEAREQENLQMRSVIRKYEEDDKIAAQKRQVEIERSKIEVIAANHEAIARKKDAKEREKAEMEDILRYQAMKDAELARREEEEMNLERQKKELQAKLLAMQERSQNKQAELDELRARRAAEGREREARRKEKEEVEKKKSEMLRLQDDRSRQARDRREKEEREKALQEMEFKKTLAYMAEQSKIEEREQIKKKNAAKAHRDLVLRQIDEAEARKKRERTQKFEEGAKLREEEEKELAKLALLQEHMVHDLELKGIDPRYLAEMKAVDIAKMLKR